MLNPLSRASSPRQAFSAAVRFAVASRQGQMRSFIAPTVSRRADFVQELYLKELKAYKPTPIKPSDANGQVATFNAPKPPKSPEETDLAASLKEYESMVVEVEGRESSTLANPATQDWLVDEEEDEAHGH